MRTAQQQAHRWNLLLPHRERLLTLLRHRCSDPDSAEDCVQEALIRVAGMGSVDGTTVDRLLTRVALNLAADSHRLVRRDSRLRSRLAERVFVTDAATIAVARAEAQSWAVHAAGLPDRERSVLSCRVHGLTAGETARRLGISYGAAASALTRARATLRAAITVTDPDSTPLHGQAPGR